MPSQFITLWSSTNTGKAPLGDCCLRIIAVGGADPYLVAVGAMLLTRSMYIYTYI